jgi:metal-sulfur cluster biosynthetic enzyme
MSLIKNKETIKNELIKKLQNIYDPEIPVNIYDLGLIYKIDLIVIKNYMNCIIEMTLTSPACPVAEGLIEDVKYFATSINEIDEVNVNLVFDPPWDINKMSEEAKEIMIASGAII